MTRWASSACLIVKHVPGLKMSGSSSNISRGGAERDDDERNAPLTALLPILLETPPSVNIHVHVYMYVCRKLCSSMHKYICLVVA